jgi:hypothetical protein
MADHKKLLERVFGKNRLDVGTAQKAGESRLSLIDTAHRGLPEVVAKADAGDVEVTHIPLLDRGNFREPLPAHVRKRAPEAEPKEGAAEIRQRFATATEATKADIAALSERPPTAPRRPKARESNLSAAIREAFGLNTRKAERRQPKSFAESLAAAHAAAQIMKIEAVQRLLASAPGVQKVDVSKASPADRQRDLKRERLGAYLDGLQVRGDE